VELEPEVRDWLEALPTAQFATAAFCIDLLADQGPLEMSLTRGSWMASCVSCGFISTALLCG